MIYIATTHFQEEKWVDIQHKYLSKYLDCPFKIYSAIVNIPHSRLRYFDRWIEGDPNHWTNLNNLAALVCEDAEEDDVIIFLDSDAFPIAPLWPSLEASLHRKPLVAACRLENWYDPFPHPLFCATRVKTWRSLAGDWSKGEYTNCFGACSDVGGVLEQQLLTQGIEWEALRKTNRACHGIFFAIYGNLIYHHGAGSRLPVSRYDLYLCGMHVGQKLPLVGKYLKGGLETKSEFLQNCSAEHQLFCKAGESTRDTSDKIFQLLSNDQLFPESLESIEPTLSNLWTYPQSAYVGSKTLALLGMHRSGTSFTAQLAKACGGGFPTDLCAPTPANRNGNHESQSIVRLNDQLLDKSESNWRCPPSHFSICSAGDDSISQLMQKLKEECGRDRTLVLKDPRFVLMLPLWTRHFGDTYFLICFRNPMSVAKSLLSRNQIPIEEGLELWLKYNRFIVSYFYLLRFPVACLNFDQIENSLPAIQSLFSKAGISGQIKDHIKSVYAEDLKHHLSTDIPSTCRRVYSELDIIWKECLGKQV